MKVDTPSSGIPGVRHLVFYPDPMDDDDESVLTVLEEVMTHLPDEGITRTLPDGVYCFPRRSDSLRRTETSALHAFIKYP